MVLDQHTIDAFAERTRVAGLIKVVEALKRFTEHHFHIEGFELSNNPVLLDLYFAMQTKRIRVVTGIFMSTAAGRSWAARRSSLRTTTARIASAAG